MFTQARKRTTTVVGAVSLFSLALLSACGGNPTPAESGSPRAAPTDSAPAADLSGTTLNVVAAWSGALAAYQPTLPPTTPRVARAPRTTR